MYCKAYEATLLLDFSCLKHLDKHIEVTALPNVLQSIPKHTKSYKIIQNHNYKRPQTTVEHPEIIYIHLYNDVSPKCSSFAAAELAGWLP